MEPKAQEVQIEDQAFLIANAMRDCPAHMVIRELLQNAIEATGACGKIEWFITEWHGVRKLGLHNEGVGMSPTELDKLMGSIASSGKEMGFDKNFGMGAKMSAGKASPYGLVYRSCKDGEVSQIWLQVREELHGGKVLVKVPQYDRYDHEYVSVLNVNADVLEQGRDLRLNWTDAILLGRNAQDETVKGNFLGEASRGDRGQDVGNWLIRLITHRYYSFPEGVKIGGVSVTVPSNEMLQRLAPGLGEVLRRDTYTARAEEVSLNTSLGRITIIYGRLTGNASDRKPQGGGWYAAGITKPSHVCLVWRNEVYGLDVRWGLRAGAYGFNGVNEDYYIHILLPEDAPIRNNFHRTLLELDNEDATVLTCEEFSGVVREHRPAWVLEEIRQRAHVDTSGYLKERLAKIAAQLRSYAPMPVVMPGEGMDPGIVELGKQSKNGAGEHPVGPDHDLDGGPLTRHGLGRRTPRARPETLQVIFKDIHSEPGWHDEHQGKAGQYDGSINTLYLNKTFVQYARLDEWVHQEWSDMYDCARALRCLDDEYCCRAAVYGMAALHFRGDDHWTPDEYLEALTPEALSSAMLDPLQTIQLAVKTTMGKELNPRIRRETGGMVHAN